MLSTFGGAEDTKDVNNDTKDVNDDTKDANNGTKDVNKLSRRSEQ